MIKVKAGQVWTDGNKTVKILNVMEVSGGWKEVIYKFGTDTLQIHRNSERQIVKMITDDQMVEVVL